MLTSIRWSFPVLGAIGSNPIRQYSLLSSSSAASTCASDWFLSTTNLPLVCLGSAAKRARRLSRRTCVQLNESAAAQPHPVHRFQARAGRRRERSCSRGRAADTGALCYRETYLDSCTLSSGMSLAIRNITFRSRGAIVSADANAAIRSKTHVPHVHSPESACLIVVSRRPPCVICGGAVAPIDGEATASRRRSRSAVNSVVTPLLANDVVRSTAARSRRPGDRRPSGLSPVLQALPQLVWFCPTR